MELLIKNVRIVDWNKDFIGDVYIKNGIINQVSENINVDCEIINGEEKTLMPSFVDLHAHFREPGFTYKEDIESGSEAAVKGGYTALNLMANTKPVCSSMETVEYVLDKAEQIGLATLHQTVSITKDLDGKDISHLDSIDKKVRFISDDGKGVEDNYIMLKAMNKAKEKDLILISHAEAGDLSKVDMRLAENFMTWRDVELAKYTGCHLHMAHVSTKEAMEYIIEAKDKGHNITCEITPHHIALSENLNYRVNPPIRGKDDIDFLIKAIKNGYVDAIATDHAPHSEEDKKNGAPGISGIETSFAACYTKLVKAKHISLSKLSEIMSKSPASIMNLNIGAIEQGYKADLVLVDLEKSYEIDSEKFISKGKNTPFNGMNVQGEILLTLKEGKKVFEK
ncbi:dihydroorotase [Clostridium grantii]|uniref:Dihydroorotase n=1 Tax=Clostridium grantii DSM 8605 TaxID=1121316 RepID=A0A1M5WAM9_9CLOT|nr:dihydroorotase [Clostridium grantii]SHH84639.1 dihydroorotase [Clostridium grantii DSM 8605]